jgi:hypothetical protein
MIDFSGRGGTPLPSAQNVTKITLCENAFVYLAVNSLCCQDGPDHGDAIMKTRLESNVVSRGYCRRAATLGLFVMLLTTGSAFAQGTPEQRRACTPDVYRLCAGEIPNVPAIRACLRRQRANLSPACAAVFER